MATTLTKTRTTNSAEQTEAWAASLGAKLRGGELIELVSDLGGGKTTFVRGLLRGMGSSDHVTSPTYTISKVYKADQLEVHHFDFYRLPEAGLINAELAEVLSDPHVVVIMEWAGIVAATLPQKRLTIKIHPQSGDRRLISANYPKVFDYLFESTSDKIKKARSKQC